MEIRRLRVLLADDDEDDYRITQDLLASIGCDRFELDWAPSYSAALHAIESNDHDLYLFDYSLGESDGLELLRKATDRGCKAPIIFLTGLDDWETDVLAMKGGAMDYLVKGGLDAKTLERSIRYALDRKAKEEELRAYAAEIENKNRELAEAVRVAREATELKTQFLANISHEIRTPMNGVMGMAELLLSTDLSAEQREYAHTVSKSGQELMEIIDNVLDLSQMEAGRLQLDATDFQPAAVATDVVRHLSVGARAKGLELEASFSAQANWRVRGDAARLRQVLTNLAGNGIKFTERGKVSVEVRLLKSSDQAASYVFEVRDTGIGMSAEVKNRLFKPFVQGDGSTTRKHGGAGVGLAICRHLVEMMDGRIAYESEPNRGSRFWLTVSFPLAATRSVESLAAEPPVEIPTLTGEVRF